MGKCFEQELQSLGLIYDHAVKCDVKCISDFLAKFRNEFLLLVGSGGSYSVAAAVEYFCIRAGMNAKKITPLDLTQYKDQLKDSAVILFTASGKNADSKNAYKFASELEADGILTVCMSLAAPISKIQRFNLHNSYFEYQMPVKKDGYLAVESLVSSIVIMAKAFGKVTGNSFFELPSSIPSCNFENMELNNVLLKDTIITLGAGMTIPAAVDLESKFGEVSLGNIQLLDFRNFAHGRHFWLSDRPETTGIIAIVDNRHKKLADKTLKLIPDYIAQTRIDIENESIEGVLKSFIFILGIVKHAGELRNINPGKPTVKEFGRKLYHLSYQYDDNQIKQIRKNPIKRALYRKQGVCIDEKTQMYREAKDGYDRLVQSQYKGIVFDYDGTLHIKGKMSYAEIKIYQKLNELLSKGIKIGIATGRGKSVRVELQKCIQRQYWDDIAICYYNGGCVGLLSDDCQPDKKSAMVPAEFKMISDILGIDRGFAVDGLADENPYQLSIMEGSQQADIGEVREWLGGIGNIKVLVSSHSMDIIPWKSSKINIFDFYKKIGYDESDFLKVGDTGQYGGNDFELLNSANGISVDRTSKSAKYCWNYLSLGNRNLEGTLELLEWLKVSQEDKNFMVEVI